MSDIAIATPTSRIAIILLPCGRTAHSRFKIPVQLLPTITCNIKKQGDLVKLIKEAKVIIWDEAPTSNQHALEALSRTFIDVLGRNMPFVGEIMFFGGDFRQILPVIQKFTRDEIISASIVKFPLWRYVSVLHFKQNMRSVNDREFTEFLLRVRDGSKPKTGDDLFKIPNSIALSWNGIDNIFPEFQNHTNDAGYMLERSLITPLNDDVDKINERVITQFNRH